MIELKYSSDLARTFGASHKPDIRVGIAIMANAPSIILSAKSIETTENIPTLKITKYLYGLIAFFPKRNLAHADP